LLPYQIKDIVAIEMLSGFEWYKHVKGNGTVISNNKFGHSAEWNEEYKKKMNFDMQYIIEIFKSKLC
jgi:transketolase